MRFANDAILWTLPALLVVCAPSASQAEIVRFRMTGTVSIVDTYGNLLPPDLVAGADSDVLNPPDPDVPGGKKFVAYWSYDTSVLDSSPEPYFGTYIHPLADPLAADYGLTIQIDEYLFRMDTSSEPYRVGVGVGRLIPDSLCTAFGCADGIGVNSADVIAPFEYSEFAGYPIELRDRITMSINDSFQSMPGDSTLPSDNLPTGLDISEFSLGRIQIDALGEVSLGSNLPPSYLIQGWIQEITRIPEPSSLCLFTLTTSIFAWRYRR